MGKVWELRHICPDGSETIAETPDGEKYTCPHCGDTFEWGPDPTIPEEPTDE